MAYHVFNIGKPATSAWWAQNIARRVITAGFNGSSGDKGELKLQKMDEGDWVLAFANGHGYVGAGRVQGAKTYRLHTASPPRSLSDHRHERKVDWIYYVDDVEQAVTVAEAGSHAPRNTKERMDDELATRIIHLLRERSGSSSDDPSGPPLTGEYCCELWGPRGWRTVSVTHALTRPERIVRCPECHGAVRLHMAGPNGVPRAHAEHRVGHPGCTLGHYFKGIRSPHPFPVVDPFDSELDAASSIVMIEDDESSFPEGKESFRLHRRLERDGRLPRRVKAARLRETGRLECEVCRFDFSANYGPLGDGFIEAHHRRPVHQLDGNEKTKAVDLALVCSNCHRMLHRATPQMSVEELQAKLLKKRFDFSGNGRVQGASCNDSNEESASGR